MFQPPEDRTPASVVQEGRQAFHKKYDSSSHFWPGKKIAKVS